MAKVTWAPGISSVSGALSKINKKSPHAADMQMLLATHRVAPTTNEGACNRLYLRGIDSVTRTTPVTADEQANRNRFKAVSLAVKQRRNNLEVVASDLAAFKAQKDTPGGNSRTVTLTGCNVTRTITSKSEYYQRGDTSCMIQTKTIESYDATKRLY